ncbi:outer membrane beta-barrel protein [Rhodopseudomonas palustris]|nr:outer membrane beta-barrel protein [Rhodopseudomonas palustris]
MRRVVVAAAVGVMAQTAYAADMPDYGPLRGALVETPRVINWEGFYVGAQGGYGTSDMDFSNSTSDIASNLLVNTVIQNQMSVSSWPVLGKASSHGQGWGAFAGYNAQWDDVVLGVEANYMHGSFGGAATGSMGRQINYNNVNYSATYTSSAAINVNDMGSARLRAGYAFGSFLPYAFIGASLGQADIVRTATITGTQGGVPFTPLSATQVQNGHFIYGYAGGLGMDMMLYRGLFLRAEWEYLKFAAPIDTSVSTVRAGLGYKF